MTSVNGAEFVQRISQLSQDASQLKTLLGDARELFDAQDEDLGDQLDVLARSVAWNTELIKRSVTQILKQIEQLNALAHTAALINSSLEPQQVLDGVIDTIIQLTGAERAYIVLRSGDQLRTAVARNWDQGSINESEQTFSRTIIQQSLQTGQPVLSSNAADDARFANAQSLTFAAMRSVLCVPLIQQNEAIGVVYCDNRTLGGVFSDESIQMVQIFAQQAAVAISNAHAYQKVKSDLRDAQRNLERLQVTIDHSKREERVQEITETSYFKRLEQLARAARDKMNAPDEDE